MATEGMNKETLLRFIKLALVIAEAELPRYSHKKSPHRYQLAQLCVCCLLKVLLRQNLREIETMLSLSPEICKALGLKRVPDHSTLCRFEQRWLTAERLDRMLGSICAKVGITHSDVAADSTGLEVSRATPYFEMRRGGRRKAYIKLSVIIALGSLFALRAVADLGPSNDKVQLRSLLPPLPERIQVGEFLADAGYDAEWVHVWCREQHGITSWIPPAVHRKDGTVGGRWRNLMAQGMPEHFGKRWGVETFFSGLKRTLGSTLHARSYAGQLAEVILRTLVYTLRR
jgi:hypothetical protein